MPPEFELDGVSHSFGNVPALDNCELTIERSSTTAIIGPNGAGKSTLLDVLSGQVTPEVGRVYHRGDEITRVDAVDASKRGIVRAFQRPRLFPNLTVAENLQIGYLDDDTDLLSSVLGRCSTNEELRTKFETHLETYDLTIELDTLARNLSGGESRLVSLARATISSYSTLLLDEPSASVNPSTQERLVEQLDRIADSDKTVVFVEHDRDFVRRLADEVVVYRNGTVATTGSPRRVL